MTKQYLKQKILKGNEMGEIFSYKGYYVTSYWGIKDIFNLNLNPSFNLKCKKAIDSILDNFKNDFKDYRKVNSFVNTNLNDGFRGIILKAGNNDEFVLVNKSYYDVFKDLGFDFYIKEKSNVIFVVDEKGLVGFIMPFVYKREIMESIYEKTKTDR